VHSLRAMQTFMWAKDLLSRSPFKTRLRYPSKAPMPDLQQALQRADIVVAEGGPFSSFQGPGPRAVETKHFLKTKPQLRCTLSLHHYHCDTIL
jgi:hypothetical protein